MIRGTLTLGQHAAMSHVLLLAMVAGLLWLSVRLPITNRSAFAARYELLSEVHARSVALIAEEAAAQWPPDLPDTAYLQGETAALAGAELQNRIKRIVEAQDAVLVSSAYMQSTEPQPLTSITVAVRARSSVVALQRILLAIESEAAYLFLESLTVQSRHRAGRPIMDVNEELDLDFELTGYLNSPFAP